MALSQEVDFPSEAGMRQTVAGAPRREESIAVEFLKIGSLDQMLWLRDAVWVHRVLEFEFPAISIISHKRSGFPGAR